jgi:hypothetical protein
LGEFAPLWRAKVAQRFKKRRGKNAEDEPAGWLILGRDLVLGRVLPDGRNPRGRDPPKVSGRAHAKLGWGEAAGRSG